MKIGTIQTIINMLQDAFHTFQVEVPLKKTEQIAVLLHKSMLGSARSYHNLEHVFNLADSSDPFQTLAALFHDLVHYQVDRGLSPDIAKTIFPYIQEKGEELFLSKENQSDDRLFLLTRDVFGVEAGQKLSPVAGLNEFLSALVMNNALHGILAENDILKLSVCIEATIPFRGKNDRSQGPFEILAARLKKINTRYHISMESGEIEETIKRAVVFANKDVESFAENDVGTFLDDIWKLLPETNIALRSGETYSIRDYRQALQKQKAFQTTLTPHTIFHRYKGVPPKEEFQRLVTLAQRNISIAQSYVEIKLLAIAILEALAELTGGDAPLALFMGDLHKLGERVQRLEDFLPVVDVSGAPAPSSPIVTLLDAGRPSESNFDMKNSPLSLFLYTHLEPAKIPRLLNHAKAVFDRRLSARAFLATIDRPIVAAIAKASAAMVFTRRERLLRLASQECSQEV